MIKDIVMKQACGVDHLTHKCYLPLLLLYLKKNHIKIRAELSGKPLTYSQLLFYLCMILQRCCQKRRLSQANCYHGPHSFASAIKVISEDISLVFHYISFKFSHI